MRLDAIEFSFSKSLIFFQKWVVEIVVSFSPHLAVETLGSYNFRVAHPLLLRKRCVKSMRYVELILFVLALLTVVICLFYIA